MDNHSLFSKSFKNFFYFYLWQVYSLFEQMSFFFIKKKLIAYNIYSYHSFYRNSNKIRKF